MLRRRLIPVLYIKNGFIVRSENFTEHKILGNIISEAKRYNQWDVDELIYIDISREAEYDFKRDDHKIDSCNSITEIIQEISKVCFMPLTFGGGIRNIEDVDMRLRNGADKITLNTGAIENSDLIKEVSLKYGAQCVVISVDYKKAGNENVVFSNHGKKNTGMTVLDWINKCESLGAGEIFLNCIDRDGKAEGYDIDFINLVISKTRLPVIACGGAGNEYDFISLAEETNVSALAAGNWFHFVERAYPRAKKILNKHFKTFR
jgi:cyclase